MTRSLSLQPAPRSLALHAGVATLAAGRLIVLDSQRPQDLLFAARQLAQDLRDIAQLEWELAAGSAVPPAQIGVLITVAANATAHPQGYRLSIAPDLVRITASTAVGAGYATLTLRQIIAQSAGALPCLEIDDWPDFDQRGVMLDISRDKVPTLKTLLALIDELASWKINQIQLYTEHTFAYRQHPTVWAQATPLTGEDVLLLDAYCAERGIELVPNQNTFGHMRRWLTLPEYHALSEAPDGCDTIWGRFDEPFTLNPGDPGSLTLVRSLFDELLPHFRSRQINVGCDETVDLGQGRSKAAVAERGKGRVYLDFVLDIYREVASRGRTMQFWGDIIVEYPELVAELPRDTIALEWGYEAEHPFDEHGELFAKSGISFYVCPGTSSWNSVAGRTHNALENLRSAARAGLKHGAIGYMITDWGDNGHWQPLPVSYLGFAYGAALSWCGASNIDRDVVELLDTHVLRDQTGLVGRILYDLGDVYRQIGPKLHNSSVLFLVLQAPLDKVGTHAGLTLDGLQQASARIADILEPLDEARLQRPDAALIERELRWAGGLLQHACARATWVLEGQPEAARAMLARQAAELIAEHSVIWLARNRRGGLVDSQQHLLKLQQDYEVANA
ncbi:MAG: family 20 glycosylhydrolase [Herpetosiphonaceae bacterium]|nr:family 20 glycosylhydrolase [Herpetosiphonaceae bacterium]